MNELLKQGQLYIDSFVNAYCNNTEMFAKHLFSGPLTIINQQFPKSYENADRSFLRPICLAFNRAIILRHIATFRVTSHEIFGEVSASNYDYSSLLLLFMEHETEKDELKTLDELGAEGLDGVNEFFESLLSKTNLHLYETLLENNKYDILSSEALGWLCNLLQNLRTAKTKDELRDMLANENQDFSKLCLKKIGEHL
jgi:hypothetical protein